MNKFERRLIWTFGIPDDPPDWWALVVRVIVIFVIIVAGVGFGYLVNDPGVGGAISGSVWGMACGLAVGMQIGMGKCAALRAQEAHDER